MSRIGLNPIHFLAHPALRIFHIVKSGYPDALSGC